MPHSLWNRLYQHTKLSRLKRKHFKQNAKITLDDLYQKIAAVEKKKQTSTGPIKPELKERFEKLYMLKEDLQEKYETLEETYSDSWEEVKDTFLTSAKVLSKTLSNISKSFN